MQTQFQTMNESYIEKHYPNHSVFEAFAAKTRKAGAGVYVLFGALFAACIYGLIWSQGTLEGYRQSGETDMVQTGMVISAIFALFALLAVFCIGLTIWRSKRDGGDWLKQSAVHSKLEEGKIREFERQAMMSDSYVLKLTSGANALISGSKDGILTRDFVYLADSDLTVIPIDSLISACMVNSTYYVGDSPNRKAIPYLALYLLSKHGVESYAEASLEAGTALTELLLQRNPQLETCDGRVMTTKEYSDFKKAKNV